ncbi:MAG: glycogen synthase GlgA [Candidatus Brocadiales bacterium]|nr:glycogen synthase GlgA [Candidatus Brocadiales bacterium]
MDITYVSSEVVPFARTGGLSDVAGALPKSLQELGHKVYLFMPLYKKIKQGPFKLSPTKGSLSIPMGNKTSTGLVYSAPLPGTRISTYFIENTTYYDREGLYQDPATGKDYKDNCERFSFFSKAVLETLQVLGIKPDIIHCNDWQSALVPTYLKTLYKDNNSFRGTASLFTIHNLSYQGLFPKEDMPLTGLDWSYFNWKQLEFYGKINLLKAGIVFSDIITTVSRKYAEEIQTAEFGVGLEGVLRERTVDLYGVLNGADYSVWNPEKDKLIPANYSLKNLKGKKACKQHLQRKLKLPQSDAPIIGMIGRVASQKGLDLVMECWDELMKEDIEFVLLGTGEPNIEQALKSAAARYPGKASINIGFDNQLSHEIEAGADMFLMPSKFEPCGLNQLYSLKYGTVPIVRSTGGLADTIDASVGFSFQSYSSKEMLETIKKALKLYRDQSKWLELMKMGMLQDWSWEKSAREYLTLYQKALAKVKGA